MAVIERDLKVGKVDNFTLTLSPLYLDGEVLTSKNGQPAATVTTTSNHLIIDEVINDGVVISALCTGVSVGTAELHFNWTTQTRSRCESHSVIVTSC